MGYAVAMSQTPPVVTDEQSAALLEDLGADGLVELTARVAFMNFSARTNVSLGIPSEEYAESCGLAPLATSIGRSEEHTSELQSLMRISYAVFCLKKKKKTQTTRTNKDHHVKTTVKI